MGLQGDRYRGVWKDFVVAVAIVKVRYDLGAVTAYGSLLHRNRSSEQ